MQNKRIQENLRERRKNPDNKGKLIGWASSNLFFEYKHHHHREKLKQQKLKLKYGMSSTNLEEVKNKTNSFTITQLSYN